MLKYKKSLILLLVLSFVLSVTAVGFAQETYEIRYGTVGPAEHQYTIAATKFKELVEDKSDGRIEVTIYPDAQLGGERAMAESVNSGTLQMTTVTTDGTLPAWVPEAQIFTIPYLFKNRAHVYAVMDGKIGDRLEEKFAEKGFKHLGFVELGWRHFTNNKRPVNKPEDMKDLSLRVQESKVWFTLVEALGASPQPLPFDDLYTSLQQGVVDGQENPPATIRSMKFYEVQDYLTLDAHTYAPGSVIMNPNFYNNLPEDLQEIVDQSVEEMISYQRHIIEKKENEDVEFLATEGGMEVSHPDRSEFMEATKDVPEDEEVKELVPLEWVEDVRELGEFF